MCEAPFNSRRAILRVHIDILPLFGRAAYVCDQNEGLSVVRETMFRSVRQARIALHVGPRAQNVFRRAANDITRRRRIGVMSEQIRKGALGAAEVPDTEPQK